MIAPTQANIVLAIIVVGIISMAEITKSLTKKCLFRSRDEESPKETMEIREWLQNELDVPTLKVSLKKITSNI